MNKLVSVAFHEHPILGNLAIDFCDQSNHPVDTVLIAGENGTGDYGEQKTFQEFDKMACCDSICSMNAEELSTIFSNLKDVLDKLLTFYNT